MAEEHDQVENWYEVLEVEATAGEAEIKKAYRKQALKCHPDKYPNDKRAATKFHRLQKAYENLKDPARRRALDQKLKATVAKRKREADMDEQRKKLKTELERREKVAADGGEDGARKRQQLSMKEKIRQKLAEKREREASAAK